MAILGKLEKVRVREAWPGEASDFTPWLSADENLSSLGEELGLGSLELVGTEVGVGQFRLDLLARRVGSGEAVVIENQFGKTDHSHLGQLLTYAAGAGAEGAGAKTFVWIAEKFSEPHRAALDWLNQCTEPGISFFGVELELWRIGDSAPAPRYNVISKPNAWQKKFTSQTASASPTTQLYIDFWTNFIAFCEEKKSSLPMPTEPPSRWWLPISLGRYGFHVSLNARKKTKDLECQLWIDGRQAKTAYSLLLDRSHEITAALGEQIQYDEEATNRCKIFETKSISLTDRDNWPSINQWLMERGEAYVAFFKPLVNELKLD